MRCQCFQHKWFYHLCFCSLAIVSVLAGCSKQTASPAASSDLGPASDGTQNTAPDAMGDPAGTDSVSPKSSMNYGDWLPPKSDDPDLRVKYDKIVGLAISGDAGGLADLTMASQLLAGQLGRAGDEGAARDFFAQSGKALRATLAIEPEAINADAAAPIFYNEAVVLAERGEVAGATVALSDALRLGFSEFDRVEREELFAEVLRSDGFAEKLAGWRELAREKLVLQARAELAKGESFPFALVATDISGTEQNLEALRGKVVIVDVWGTWCPPCRAEIPHFIKLQEKYGAQGFQMIGLNYEQMPSPQQNLDVVVKYAAENDINYPCIMGDEATRSQIPAFRGFPTTVFIDKTGRVRMQAVGLHEYEFLDAIVNELIKEP